MSIVKVFNTEDIRQMIFKYKMKYNLPPIYLKMAIPLKYILYVASLGDTEQQKIRERMNKDGLFISMSSQVGCLRCMGYWWRECGEFSMSSKNRHNELVKCKMNDDRMIYVYGKKGSRFPNVKMFKFNLDYYNHHKKNYRAVVKALRIMRTFKKYYENKMIKLIDDYIKKKEKQNKQPCPICNKLMNKSSIKRHINSQHK